jgi:glycerol-3-phosphate acyltransferase PlsY
VATGVGVFLVLAPLAVLLAGIVFLMIVLLTRYVSLGSIVGSLVIPIVVGLGRYPIVFDGISVAAICCAALIIFAHRQNISRLIQGTENKFR